MEREKGSAVAENYDWTLTQKGIEEMWKGVRALNGAKEKLENSPDSRSAKEGLEGAKDQLVSIVLEAFGEDWAWVLYRGV